MVTTESPLRTQPICCFTHANVRTFFFDVLGFIFSPNMNPRFNSIGLYFLALLRKPPHLRPQPHLCDSCRPPSVLFYPLQSLNLTFTSSVLCILPAMADLDNMDPTDCCRRCRDIHLPSIMRLTHYFQQSCCAACGPCVSPHGFRSCFSF